MDTPTPTQVFSQKLKHRFYTATFLSSLVLIGLCQPEDVLDLDTELPAQDYNPATAALGMKPGRYYETGVKKLQLRAAIECTPAFDVLPQGLERRFQQADILAVLDFNGLARRPDYTSLDFISKAALFGHEGWRICADKTIMAFELSRLAGGYLKNAGMPFVAFGAEKLIGVNVASAVDLSPQRIVTDAFDFVLSTRRLPPEMTHDDLILYSTMQTVPVVGVIENVPSAFKHAQLHRSLLGVYAFPNEIAALRLPRLKEPSETVPLQKQYQPKIKL